MPKHILSKDNPVPANPLPKLSGRTRAFAKPETTTGRQQANRDSANYRYNKPQDVSRQDINNRLRALRESIEKDLKRIAGLVKRGQLDKAGHVCTLVAHKRGVMVDLTTVQNKRLAEDAKQAQEVTRKAATQVKRKIRRYARWSDK